MDTNTNTNTIIATTTGTPCNLINLVKKFATRGYTLDDGGTPKHPKKYTCLDCRREQVKNAGEGARPEALKKAYTKAYLFKRSDGMQCLACCAGHRRFAIPRNHPRLDEIEKAFTSNDVPEPSNVPEPTIEVTSPPPDFNSNIASLMETVSAAPMGVVIDY